MTVASETFPHIPKTLHPFTALKEPPPDFRIGVRLPKPLNNSQPIHPLPPSHIRVDLFTITAESSELTLATNMVPSILVPFHSNSFVFFDCNFKVGTLSRIELEFSIPMPPDFPSPSVPRNTTPSLPFASYQTDFNSMLSAKHPQIHVNLPLTSTVPPNPAHPQHTYPQSAHLITQWCRSPNEKFGLQLRVKILKSEGWPFTARRPFWVLYRWEADISSWQAVYRSEVLTEQSTARNSDGCMIFTPAILDMRKLIDAGDNDTNPLRIEFFHYKFLGGPTLLAHVSTSLRHLRQAEETSPLDIVVNIVSKGELMGNLIVQSKILSASQNFFTLQATFGGPITGNLVYFSLRLSTPWRWRRRLGLRYSSSFYTISRYNDMQDWEEVWRSEGTRLKTSNNYALFQTAKITEIKLNDNQPHRPLAFRFHRLNANNNAIPIAYFVTTVSKCREEAIGATIPIFPIPCTDDTVSMSAVGDNGECGYMVLYQSEERDTRKFFLMSCVLGKALPLPPNDIESLS